MYCVTSNDIVSLVDCYGFIKSRVEHMAVFQILFLAALLPLLGLVHFMAESWMFIGTHKMIMSEE